MILTLLLALFHTAIPLPANADDEVEAIAQGCAGCHGETGVPTDPITVPIIWGQQRTYLVKQMHDYRAGDRENEIMSPIAQDFKPADARKIAAYFAAKAWPEASGTKPVAASSPPKGIDQCQACHGTSFEGGPSGPRLAGLSDAYLLAGMNAFAAGQRGNNEDMPKFMRALTERERIAMARHISDVRPTKRALKAVSAPGPRKPAAGGPPGAFIVE